MKQKIVRKFNLHEFKAISHAISTYEDFNLLIKAIADGTTRSFKADERRERMCHALQAAKDQLIAGSFHPDNIQIEMVSEPYPTVADGIIDQCRKRKADIVMIGRKRMSKAEEFVLGDVSVKLIRALEEVAVLVVKSP